MRGVVICLILFCITACEDPSTSFTQPPPPSDDILVGRIQRSVAKKLLKEKNLHPCGHGAQMMYQIEMIALAFNYYENDLTIEKSRELLISAVDALVAEVNNTEAIRPYLANYPFEPKNVEVRIFVESKVKNTSDTFPLVIVKSMNGILQYKVKDPTYHKYFKIVHKETYEEALAKMEMAEP